MPFARQFLASILNLVVVCTAVSAEPTVESLRVGFNGYSKVGVWTQVVVGLKAGEKPLEGRLAITVLDGDGVLCEHIDATNPVRLKAGESGEFVRSVKIGRTNSSCRVSLRSEQGESLFEQEFSPSDEAAASSGSRLFMRPLLSTQELIVSVGPPIGVEEAARLRRRQPQHAIAAVTVAEPRRLPLRWQDYHGVSTLVVSTADAQTLAQWTPERAAALAEWVRLGGRLVLCVGAAGEKAVGEGGPFAPLVPGRFERVVEQPEVGAIEAFTGATHPVEAPEPGRGALRIPMTQLAEAQGHVEAAQGRGGRQTPAIIRNAVGLGEVVFVALDLDQAPFAAWRERARLVDRLLWPDLDATDVLEGGAGEGRVSHLGFEDLSGQLRAALDVFPGVQRIEFSWVAALIVLYIALIGAGDYFLLKLLGGRMELTWLTFTITVLAFCGLAWVLATTTKGDAVRLNQLDVVDVDWQTRQVRGAAWAHLYSPEAATYDLALAPELPPGEGEAASEGASSGSLLSWQGLPGGGLGGMDSRANSPLDLSYHELLESGPDGFQSSLQGMPTPKWSTKSLFGQWWTRLAADESLPQPDLHSPFQGELRGRVVNPLPVTLNEAFVYHGGWAYPLARPLSPGGTAQIGRQTQQIDLMWMLTQRRVDRDHRDVTTPWDPQSLDTVRIARLMMFFRTTGGEAYARLTHRYQDFTDLSGLLKYDRAILVGRVAAPMSRLTANGQPLSADKDRQWTYCRVVFPVSTIRETSSER